MQNFEWEKKIIRTTNKNTKHILIYTKSSPQ